MLKTKYKSTLRHYINKALADYYATLKSDRDRATAIQTVIFIKENFPECKETLRGELVEEKISTKNIGG